MSLHKLLFKFDSFKTDYSKETLTEAVEAVKQKTLTESKAALVYSIPRSTIIDHVRGRVKKCRKGISRTILFLDY